MFDTPESVESVAYSLKLSDWPRAQNRARINSLFNGEKPFSEEEAAKQQLPVNVNFLEQTILAHDGRAQGYQALLKPGRFFSARSDAGPKHKRQHNNAVVSSTINRTMKQNRYYFEALRSKIAQWVLHGISPGSYDDRYRWRPKPRGIEDVLIPTDTYLDMEDLTEFAIHRSYSIRQLLRMTSGPNVDPGWNMPLVNKCRDWIDKQAGELLGSRWGAVWSPEKTEERRKQDASMYACDAVPTIDCFDFYFWNDEGKKAGWNRRIILDSWGMPSLDSVGVDGRGKYSMHDRKDAYGKGHFLYNSGKRKYADRHSEIIGFQFADLSAVAPFKYHSVRSLGWLLYGICHLQNRLRCQFNRAVLEALMMYMRVKSMDDVERALTVPLNGITFLDESVNFIPPQERWQVNAELAELGMMENAKIITKNSSSYVQNQNFSADRVEKTKFQVMAEVNAMTTLISSALLQAYQYQKYEFQEIFRRFCIPNSRDPEVREARNTILKSVDPEILVPEAWDIEPERVMGAGNKTMEMAIAEQLMLMRPAYDPESQRKILREVTLSVTDDPARADDLVPESPMRITDSRYAAELASGALLAGLPVSNKPGLNHVDYVEALLGNLTILVARIEKRGGQTTFDEIGGMMNMADHVRKHILIIGQVEEEVGRAKKYSADLRELVQVIAGYAVQLQEQEAEKNGEGQQLDAETQAKIQAILITAKAKSDNMIKSHGARTAQKAIQFEQKLRQDAESHQLDMKKRMAEVQVETAATDIRTAAEIQRAKLQAENEPEPKAKE